MKKTPNYLAILMWASAALFFFYEFLLQVSPSVMTKELMTAFSINAAQLGVLASVYFYTYAIMQIPVGVMLDRFGVRRLLTLAAIICASGAIIFASSHSVFLAAVGRGLIGIGSSFATISCLYIASLWLPLEWFSLLTGLLITIGMTGAICGQAPLSLLVGKFHWQKAMYILGIAGFFVSLLIWSIVRDQDTISHSGFIAAEKKLLKGLKFIARNKQTWLCAAYAGLMYTPTLAFGSLWGVPFLIAKFHLTKHVAAGTASLIFVGWIIGAPLFGWLSDYCRRRKLFLTIGTVGAILCIAVVLYLPTTIPRLITVSAIFGFGFFSGGMPIAFSIAREINPPNATGAAMGFMNAINMLGGAIVPPLIGVILDKFATSTFPHHYPVIGYEVGLSLLTATLVIALILLGGITETYATCRAKSSPMPE